MWVLDPPMLPQAAGKAARKANQWLVTSKVRRTLRRLNMANPVVLTTLPYTAWLLGDVGQRAVVYNCTDDYSFWPTADRELLQEAERQIRRQARLILAASHALAALSCNGTRCEYFPHAVDFDHFASAAQPGAIPAAVDQIARPRVGFFGLIYEKIDFALLTAVAREIVGIQLVLIGPCDYCPEQFARLPNVHLLGPQPYVELPRWIAGLDVLLLPYMDDPMIRRSNPLKLRECLATGKPTVSVDIPEVRAMAPHVEVAGTTADFIGAVRRALAGAADASAAAARQAAVRADSWEARARQLHGYLTEAANS
jgi:glycosyltransferase involved in cell wall biosynthesis